MNRILYLTYNSILTSGILQSQVLNVVKQLTHKYPKSLHFILVSSERWADYTNKAMIQAFRNRIKNYPIDLIIIPKLLSPQLSDETKYQNPLRIFYNKLLLLWDFILFTMISFWLILVRNIDLIHVRSYVPALTGLLFKKIFHKKFIFDPRGLIPEELQLTQQWSDRHPDYKKWKKWELKILQSADTIIVLSEPFKKHYQSILPDLEPVIIPCCADTNLFVYQPEQRAKLSTQYQYSNKLMVLYTMGHYVPYQDLDSAVELFRSIQSHFPTAHFLILSPDKTKIQSRLQQLDLSDKFCDIHSLPFDDMPHYIPMADIGLLVRVPSIISRVSSPVKFAEYLACGVPVISQTDIGDTTTILTKTNTGRIIKNNILSDSDIQWIIKLIQPEFREQMAQQCRKTALQYLSWDNYLPVYHQIYTKNIKN